MGDIGDWQLATAATRAETATSNRTGRLIAFVGALA
jgi:hypothetical protein